MRVLLWLCCLAVWAGGLSAAPPPRAAPAPKPAVKAAKTNEPPALVKAREDLSAALAALELAQQDYQRSVPPIVVPPMDLGAGPGGLLKQFAAHRAMKMGMANTVGGYLAMGGLRGYAGDFGLQRKVWAAEDEVARRRAIVVAMLRGLQAAARTNSPAFKARPAQIEAATVKFLQEQAAAGSGRAHLDLGERLLAGRGVEVDEVKGWAHVRAAADLGHEPAQARWAARQKELDAPKAVAAP